MQYNKKDERGVSQQPKQEAPEYVVSQMLFEPKKKSKKKKKDEDKIYESEEFKQMDGNEEVKYMSDPYADKKVDEEEITRIMDDLCWNE